MLPILMFVAIGMACAVEFSSNQAHVDLWSHVRFGEDLRASGAGTSPWVNPDHLSQIAISFVLDQFGSAGLTLAKCILGLALIGFIVRHCRRMGVGLLTICAVSLLVAINLANYWTANPQIISYFCFAAMLFLLQSLFRSWSDRWRLVIRWRATKQVLIPYAPNRMKLLWMLPILFLFWSNLHGGFLLGLIALGIYLTTRSLEAWTTQGTLAKDLLIRFGCILVASVLVTSLNPFGLQLHQRLVYWGMQPWPEFLDWHAPDLSGLEQVPLSLLIVTWLFALAFTRQSRDFTGLLLTSIAAIASLESRYYAPYFTILFGFFIPLHFESVCRFFKISTVSTFEMIRPVHRWTFVTAAVGLILLLSMRLLIRPWSIQVNRSEYPVSAVKFVQDSNLAGKMAVAFHWSPYVLGKCGSNVEVALDRRYRLLYSQEAIDRHFDMFAGRVNSFRYRSPNSPGYDAGRLLRDDQPDLVLVDRRQSHAVQTMRKNRSKWTLLYQDSLAQVWGRSTRYDEPENSAYLAPPQRVVSNVKQLGAVSFRQ